jgi:hypothetical protein
VDENSKIREKDKAPDGDPVISVIPATLSSTISMSYALFCMGNPLLDIQVRNGEDLLKKYNLNPNDAILADEKKHLPMLDILSHFYCFFIILILFPLKKTKQNKKL